MTEEGVPMAIVTHECSESTLNKVLDKLGAIEEVYSIDSVIKLED